MFGKKVNLTCLTKQKNNQSEIGQKNLFWDNLICTRQPSDWAKNPGDPGNLIRSRVHRAKQQRHFSFDHAHL